MSSESWDVSVVRDGGHVTVVVRGELDAFGAARLRHVLAEEILARPRTIDIDCRAVNFMGSPALAVILRARRALAHTANGSLAITRPSAQVQRAVATAGLDPSIFRSG